MQMRTPRAKIHGILLTVGLLAAGSVRAQKMVVSTAALELAVQVLAGPESAVRTVRLMPPGACPGHFDLSPAVIPELVSARAVLRHDFQEALGRRVEVLTGGRAHTETVDSHGTLLLPVHWIELLEQVERFLSGWVPAESVQFQAALERERVAAKALQKEMERRAEPWRGTPVLASAMQAEFCRALGFEVSAVFGRPESLTPRELSRLMAVPAELVIGNLQSDQPSARALAVRRGLPEAILSNFPAAPGYGATYRDWVQSNLNQLEQAWRKR